MRARKEDRAEAGSAVERPTRQAAGAADKDRLRSSVAPHSFPAYNSSGNCRPEPAWKTDVERLGSMRGGNRVTVAYPLMRTERPQSAPVSKTCRHSGISRISRDKPDRIFAVDAHCGNSTPRVRGGCRRARRSHANKLLPAKSKSRATTVARMSGDRAISRERRGKNAAGGRPTERRRNNSTG